MCDTCNEHNKDMPLPVDHPRLSAVAGWLYDNICEPVNRLIAWVATGLAFNVKDNGND